MLEEECRTSSCSRQSAELSRRYYTSRQLVSQYKTFLFRQDEFDFHLFVLVYGIQSGKTLKNMTQKSCFQKSKKCSFSADLSRRDTTLPGISLSVKTFLFPIQFDFHYTLYGFIHAEIFEKMVLFSPGRPRKKTYVFISKDLEKKLKRVRALLAKFRSAIRL